MPITVIVRPGDESQAESEAEPLKLTFDGARIVIGRGAGCDVRLPDSSVSHRHATIRAESGDYSLVDEGSTNGSFVGGVKVAARTSRLLRSGDLVRLGRVWLEVRIDQAPATRDLANATRDIALALMAQAMERAGEDTVPRVRVVEGRDLGAILCLSEEGKPYVIGRGPDCDLPLADHDASREHASVARRGAAVMLCDLGAKNGIVLGEARLAPSEETLWKPIWMARLGRTVLALEEPLALALSEVESLSDVPMRADEAPPAPANAQAKAKSKTDAPPSSSLVSPRPNEPGGAAPIAEVKDSGPVRKKKGSRWSALDLVVIVIAVTILTLSVTGLIWLVRS